MNDNITYNLIQVENRLKVKLRAGRRRLIGKRHLDTFLAGEP